MTESLVGMTECLVGMTVALAGVTEYLIRVTVALVGMTGYLVGVTERLIRQTQPTQLLLLILMTLTKLGHWLFLEGRFINRLALSAIRILRSAILNPHWRAMQT